jgi:predicted ATPase/DNA-binding CsgD family transcriptional regulator
MSIIPAHTWIEPFSSRESEILGLISMGMSNHEIARKLHLSPETVKWYNKQIFSKLGVSSRTLAVARAREYHLLSLRESAPVEEQPRVTHNLPARISSFVGRSEEIDEVKQMLRTSRLVVLTGPGGTGKTRLATEAAAQLVDSYRDGVWLVELAPIQDAGLVAEAIAQVLRLGIRGNAPVIEMLKHSLKSKHLLLIIDNFEHLPQATPLVGELLAAAPRVSVLATSRERLHLYGEQEYLVSPLSLPDPARHESAEQLMAYDAVKLFIERARATRPGFTLQESQAEALAQVCVRLDGLPLALELAASQVKIFSPTALAQRLSDIFNALPAGPRDLPARQRTLRATIQWSYDLLAEAEKTLLTHLAVFRGGATLEAVEQVCAASLDANLMDLLSALVDKNLVLTRETREGELRFSMLETIHEYAWECLQSRETADSIRHNHAAYFTSLAEHAAEEIRDRRQSYWYARLLVEQDNLRAALAWSLYGSETEYGVRLAAALRDYWYYNGNVAEARRWMDLALERSSSHPLALRAGLLLASGGHTFAEHELNRGAAELQEALHIYNELGDERLAAWSKIKLGITYMDRKSFQEGAALAQAGLEVFMRLGDLPGIAQAYNILGELARLAGDDDAAQEFYETCMDVSVESGEQMRVAMSYVNMGFIAYHRGEFRNSAELVRQGLIVIRSLENDYGLSTFIGSMAGPLARLGDPERAARLLGASFALLEAKGSAYQPSDMPEIEEYLRVTKELMGEPTFREAWQSGQSMTLEEAVDLALSPLMGDEQPTGEGHS